MWARLTPRARHRISEAEFAADLSDAEQTATVSTLRPTNFLAVSGKTAEVGFTIVTHIFGRLHEDLSVPLVGSGGSTQIGFNTSLLFPGLERGELLSRTTLIGQRGTLLAASGQVLVHGTSLSGPIPEVASDIAGSIGPIPLSQSTLYAEQGYPVNARVGVDGLEEIFQRRLAGRLGGSMRAGNRVLARAKPGHGATVRTTIVPALEQDAESGLGGKLGGITIMNPRTGAIEAAAGIAFTDVQPPGSTFKIVTTVAALQAGLATPSTTYPYESHIVLDGFKMQNAGGETCGGTLSNAFANSCDTTFAPLGARLGGAKLVAMAERFGFDRATGIASALESTIPQPDEIGSPVSVGASAIGQGLVQASTLEMADVAATIADRGRRPLPTLLYGARPRFVRVTTPKIAGEVQRMMVAVVSEGTGTTARIPGITVAGKTGTAELRDTAGTKNEAKYTDAWFVGYAPVGHPKVVVAALFPNAGYGADTAAPVVRQLIEDALGVG
ncbi:MAG TPA: penicillin-binding transpeptidase domain-containing protein [Solirubrobacteraceae bacterium]|jgi:cell division protein FtsI/penicillin-binding protein 2|nr:penicillin-binding transpeptidase domain-containing protein [Solirubrobacteraceae bacterium]